MLTMSVGPRYAMNCLIDRTLRSFRESRSASSFAIFNLDQSKEFRLA